MKGVWHIVAGAAALIAPFTAGEVAFAQTAGLAPMPYGNPDATDQDSTVSDNGAPASAPPAAASDKPEKPGKRTRIVPYLEIDQTVYDEIAPREPAVTYSTIAAGADMVIAGHRTQGTATIRVEHHFSETPGVGSSTTFTGIARTTTDLVPHTLTFDLGGLATRTAISQSGGTLLNPVDNAGPIDQIWSLYGGPSLSTHIGVANIKASYLLGYSEIDQIRSFTPTGATAPLDLFSHSLSQQGSASIGVRPGEVLPFGLALMGSHLQEDMSNLDQRLVDDRLQVQATQPVSRTTALVGDVGWEKVTVSQRDAQLDANGNPVVAPDGQYVVDRSQPRKLAYRSDGLTWDVGVIWRPSRRTMAEVFYGRRYDSATYYGSFNYAPDSRQMLNVSAYDGIYGFGSGLLTALQQVPTDFTVMRDPFSGNVGSCFLGTAGAGCVTGALGSAQAAIFHARGINAAYSVTLGRVTFNVGTGYIQRRFITAPGTVLAAENGVLDQNFYVNAGLSGPIDRATRFMVNGFGSLYHTDQLALGDTGDWGVNGTVIHHLTDRLVGTASVEVLGVSQQMLPDQTELMGQLGLRYSFR